MRNLGTVAALVAGCGRIGFDGLPPGSNGDCWAPWRAGTIALTPPALVTGLGGGQLANPALSADALTLYFNSSSGSDLASGQHFYSATRPDRSSPWGNVAAIAELSSTSRDDNIDVSDDGTIVVFGSDRVGGKLELWYATRAGPTGTFSQPTQAPVAALNVDAAEFDPELAAAGLHLYYSPEHGTNQLQDIRVATRATTADAFGTPVVVLAPQANSAADPCVSPDELVMVFSFGASMNANDLYYTTRADPHGAFGPLVEVPAVNLPQIDDGDAELSRDGCELFFSSARSGRYELYTALAQ